MPRLVAIRFEGVPPDRWAVGGAPVHDAIEVDFRISTGVLERPDGTETETERGAG